MFKTLINSIKSINYKLFLALLTMALVPTIYTTVRIFWLGNFPGNWQYSIAGQLSWINLIYEIINEAIILPLFYFMGKVIKNKKDLTNRIKTGLLVTLIMYLFLSIGIMIFTEELLELMATDKNIIEQSAQYIRIEAVANIFIILFSFISVSLITLNKYKVIYISTFVKLILSLLFDTFLISNLKISFNLGVNGIGISNIVVNFVLFIVSILFLFKYNINIFNKDKMNFKWLSNFSKVAFISGLESFVRNLAYIIMISRMINIVGEQGTFWVANSFIWGWLLLPILQLGELIKQEISINKTNIKNNTLGYFFITILIVIIWCLFIPLYKPFMKYILNYNDVEKLFNIVIISLIFYVMFALQNIFDSTFYGLGKTHYMLFESVVTNTIYYGTSFILWKLNIWQPSLINIVLLFGIGIAFDTLVSLGAYIFLLKKENINIFNISKN